MKFDNSVDNKEWCSFRIDTIFEVYRPSARVKTKYDDGEVAFVASGNFNNGVERYVTPLSDDILDKGNCITISPLTGTAYYQEYPFLGRGGAGSSILILRNENLDKNNALFICTVISKVCAKYSYNDMGNLTKVRNELIFLPCVGARPDWEYMSNYIDAIYNKVQDKIKQLQILI